MCKILLIASLAFAGALSGEITRVFAPTAGIVADPASGRLIAIEGVGGRLNLGKEVWPTAVEAAWLASESYALVQVDGAWKLLAWNRDWALTRTVELGVQDWSRVVWNPGGSAWLACGDVTPGCAVYRVSDGTIIRRIEGKEKLGAVALADNAGDALLQRGNGAVVWGKNDDLTVIEGAVVAGAFLPGQSRLAVIQDAGPVLLFDAATPNPVQLETGDGAIGTAWTPDGRSLVIAYRDGKIRLIDDSGRISAMADCECRPGGLWQMGRGGMFRLQESTKQQLFVVRVEDGTIQFSILPAREQEVR